MVIRNEELEAQIERYKANNFNLPFAMKPILQLSSTAELLIIGPAPGVRAHNTGIPWNDRSGDRLRSWLALSRQEFYDAGKIALISMNFWYPGSNKYGYDNPPNVSEAKLWHRPLLKLMPNIKLTLLVGSSAQAYILKARVKATMTETIRSWREYLPKYIVLPHPSWHNNIWIKKYSWFEHELIPALRKEIKTLYNDERL
jgi:uracil-DNA glycosylase